MSSLPTPPHFGLRVPLPRAPREGGEAEHELLSGDILEGRYQIEDRLGEGGVGFVYRARLIKLHRRVAIKLLQSENIGDEELKPRFEREALTLAALSHPHIVALIDYGSLRGRPYLVMELLEGRTLREVIDQEGALEPVRALSIARQVLLALAYAHELGIVHRDLKPANLLMQTLPCHEHVKVLDFGLVKFTPGSYLDRGVQLSRVGFTFGTPAYMSPEHAVGDEVDGRSDLYSVGVLLFELLTGEKPFEGELQDVLRHHFQTPVPKLWKMRGRLNGRSDLQTVIETAMAKEREDRYADAAAMIAAIDALIGPKSRRASEPTEQVSLFSPPSHIDALRRGVSRVTHVAREKGQAALVTLRHGKPLLLRAAHGLGGKAKSSLALTKRVSTRVYAWLKPRAVAAAHRLRERARAARSGGADRQVSTATHQEPGAAELVARADSTSVGEAIPASVEGALPPVEDPPAPVEDPPAPVEEPPAPMEDPPAPMEDPPAPIEVSPAYVEGALAAGEGTSAKGEGASSAEATDPLLSVSKPSEPEGETGSPDCRAMRVLFSSTRGIGHLNPLLPFARALVANGHQVAVAGPMELAEAVRAAGLTHVPFDHPGDEILVPIWARLRGVSQQEANTIAIREIFAGANARAALPKLRATIAEFRPDLIVRESVEFAALIAAETAGVPHVRVAVHMVSFEEPIPALASPSLDALRQQAGLPADEGSSLLAEPVFSWFPPLLDGSLDDGSRTQIPFRAQLPTGAPRAETPSWAPADVETPLVYITLGTIAGSMPEGKALYRTVLDAIAELPVHALLTTGHGADLSTLGAIPANVRVEAFVPQRDVLPRAAAVVCHGGSGTVQGALDAGVPMVVVPLGADQPHNAQRIAEVGAGIALPKPDAATLRTAIERVLAEPGFRSSARRLSAEITALPTIERAVAALLDVANRRTTPGQR